MDDINLEGITSTGDSVKNDQYDLNFSENFLIKGSQEIIVDLALEQSQADFCSISGNVVDDAGLPVEGATIKLFDSEGNPFLHTVTNSLGNYSFSGLKSGNYSITCVKNDIVLTVAENLYLQDGEIKTYSFTVNYNPNLSLCSIAGLVLQEDTNEIIAGATVRLLEPTIRRTIASTLTASDGEYVFYDITAGDYIVVATKQGYQTSADTFVSAINNTIINTNIKLELDPIENLGTISGVIKHQEAVVANAFVGLYKILEDGKELLIATTRSNSKGVYMFGKVEGGNYKVKAKLNRWFQSQAIKLF